MKPLKLKPTRTADGWSLNIPSTISATSKRQRLFFPTRDKAEAFAAPLRAKHHAGETATILKPQLARLAQRAFSILGDLPPEDILAAATAWREAKNLRGRSITMRDLFSKWGTYKTRKPKFMKRLAQLERRCEGILDFWVCDVTPEAIENHAIRDAAPSHRNQIIRELRGMFNHAGRKRWMEGSNPVDAIDKADVKKRPTAIYSPEQIALILKTTAEHCEHFIPSLALMIFAGVRPENETLILTWEEIDLEEGFVDVAADTDKMDGRRHIVIEPALRAWLLWYIERHGVQSGRVCPWGVYRSIKRNRDRILAIAEVQHSTDIYRHTFASAHVCFIGDLARIVLEMGHKGDSETLWNHYYRVMKKTAAKAFWSLTPSEVLG
jgi:integrase